MQKAFGKFRSFFWPIHRFELKKVLPMFFLFFCFYFNYMILKDIEEPLVVTAPGSGAETVAFIKLWVILPLAILFMFIYSKLLNKFSKKRVFYTVITFFISFYFIFAFVLYPLKDVLHPHAFADKLTNILPVGFAGFISIIRNWSFALFYAFGELWGSVGISLLFWGFSNDITKVQDSKRFYALFGIGSSLAMMVAGPTIIHFANIRNILPSHIDAWGITLKCLMSIVALSGLIIMGLYYWMNRYVLSDEKFKPNEVKDTKNKKMSLSLKEAFKIVFKSRYLMFLAALVMGYSVSMTLGDIVWKSQLKLRFSDPNDYTAFRGFFTSMSSVLSLITLFIGGSVIRKWGWKKAAITTPIVLLISGIGAFGFIVFQDSLKSTISFLGTTPLVLAIVFASIQNGFGKCCKLSFYEPTKEMAYIPLDDVSKTKGKAAIDVLVCKFSKAGGAFLLQALIIIFGSIAASVPYIALILFGVIAIWIISASKLNKLILNKTTSQEKVTSKSKAISLKAASKKIKINTRSRKRRAKILSK
ncbi:MAG: ADP,ATP carrier protein 1 [Candidatus Anoxychlamydiales bacterium]|nr:ADP,ATP carrier protein 1 [Candidatus Anoxychlamydiales bacterium]